MLIAMAKEITVTELFPELKEKLNKIHNLISVQIGIMQINQDDFLEQERPQMKREIAYGEIVTIADGLESLLELFKKEKNNYAVTIDNESQSTGNLLYVKYGIDTSTNYSADDLFDDELFNEPFTLIKN